MGHPFGQQRSTVLAVSLPFLSHAGGAAWETEILVVCNHCSAAAKIGVLSAVLPKLPFLPADEESTICCKIHGLVLVDPGVNAPQRRAPLPPSQEAFSFL